MKSAEWNSIYQYQVWSKAKGIKGQKMSLSEMKSNLVRKKERKNFLEFNYI